MATTTTNYGLAKPEGDDFYDVGVFNDNADKIDEQLKKNADAIENKKVDVATTKDAGIVKPDGDTITVDGDGTIHGQEVTFDKAPTKDSTNAVESGGLYTEIEAVKKSIAQASGSAILTVTPNTSGGSGTSTITVTDGTTTNTVEVVTSGQAVTFKLGYGTWTVSMSDGNQTSNVETVNIDTLKNTYAVTLAYFSATITATVNAACTVTAKTGTTTYTAEATAAGTVDVIVHKAGDYTVTASAEGETDVSATTTISASGDKKSVTVNFFRATITVSTETGASVVLYNGTTKVETKTAASNKAVFTVKSAGTYHAVATLNGETSTSEDKAVSTSGSSVTIEAAFRKIYGVTWDGTSSTKMTRTDAAASFVDPVPYISGATSYSSPFDDCAPWSGMKKVTNSSAGAVVSIPKFWYKMSVTSGGTFKLQIADKKTDGYSVAPAFMDRGDGTGERDVVYVGRYHCGSSNYKSASGQAPKASITRATARTSIHSLGSTVWQYDYAMHVTIWMLYLVEFANWNSQAAIGYGCSASSAVYNCGATDSMPYHTGTTSTSRTDYASGVQYRYIEDLWGNVFDWCDGIYFSSANCYIVNNPANFSDTSNGTNVGTRPTAGSWITSWKQSTVSGYDWFIYPSNSSGGSDNTYICDYCDYGSSGVVLYVGGGCGQNQHHGLFYLYGYDAASYSNGYIGCRLQVLP